MAQHVRAYDNATPERKAAAVQRAMSREHISASDRSRYERALRKRDGETCFYCREPLTTAFHIDHMLPVVRAAQPTWGTWCSLASSAIRRSTARPLMSTANAFRTVLRRCSPASMVYRHRVHQCIRSGPQRLLPGHPPKTPEYRAGCLWHCPVAFPASWMAAERHPTGKVRPRVC